jgi:hypothetical protein
VRVLVLSPSLTDTGGIQRYVLTLVRALKDTFGTHQVRVVSLNLPKSTERPSRFAAQICKARFVTSGLLQGVTWRPDLVICAHVGFAPLGRLLRGLGVARYWVMAYGIDVWAHLPQVNRRALDAADRVIAISSGAPELFASAHFLIRAGMT